MSRNLRTPGYHVTSPGFNASLGGKQASLYLDSKKYQDILRYELFDTLRFQAGQALTLDEISMFKNPIGSTRYVANNTGVDYKTKRHDTNQAQANQIPKGYTFAIESIQAQILTLGNLNAVSGTGDNVGLAQQADIVGTHGGITSATKQLEVILNTITLATEFMAEKRYEHGLLVAFPCEFGMHGAVASNTGLNESFVQNGFGVARPLAIPRVLESLDHFEVKVQPQVAFIPANDFQIRIWLVGAMRRVVQ